MLRNGDGLSSATSGRSGQPPKLPGSSHPLARVKRHWDAYYDRTSNCLQGDSVVDRRTFIGGVAGGLVVVPLVARAQQPAIPVIGFLNSRAAGDDPHLLAAFRQGLKEVGYVEGQNVEIEYRFAEGQDNRLPALAADLGRRHVAVIAANGFAAQAAKAATAT